ncbi:hypothetical protein [Actinomadura gamaensis]|uniref:Uncharacterized protein n=1 Tax=Actinomadura gamaensis TaxID=1763541 RepID=A0ABV9TYB3_9ACTN
MLDEAAPPLAGPVPTPAEARSSLRDAEPALGTAPTLGEAEPTASHAAPVLGEAEPTPAPTRPTSGNAEPTLGTAPTLGKAEPTASHAAPVLGEAEPTLAGMMRTLADTEPTLTDAAPTLGTAERTLTGAVPTLGNAERTLVEAVPRVRSIAPAPGHSKPTFSRTPLAFGAAAPAVAFSSRPPLHIADSVLTHMPLNPQQSSPTASTASATKSGTERDRRTRGFLGPTEVSRTRSSTARTPDPRDVVPSHCLSPESYSDWYTAQMCRAAWVAALRGQLTSPRYARTPPPSSTRSRKDFSDSARTPMAPSPRKQSAEVSKKPPTRRDPAHPSRSTSSAHPTPLPSASREVPSASHSDKQRSLTSSLRPLILLGILLSAMAAVGYPFRRRIYALAGSVLLSQPLSDSFEGERTLHFSYRPAVDPFAIPLFGLTGPGAPTTARVFTLAALEECADTALVVIPRADATALFGLAEDELLDERIDSLFIPGSLDAALAYLETELAVRHEHGSTGERRLLLIADCEKEARRIIELAAHHSTQFSAVLLGEWPGDKATVDDDGLLAAPSTLSDHLPVRLPAVSRTEARDRLLDVLGLHPHRPHSRKRNKIS